MSLIDSHNNTNNKHLTLNGKVFLYDEIKIEPLSYFNLTSDFEKSTIKFCKEWLNAAKEFKINTSGSTGKPKTINITRSQMIRSAENTAKAFGLISEDSILVNLNTKYIAGMMMLVRGLHLKLTMYIVEPSSNPLLNIEFKHNFYAFVPLQLQSIIESNNSNKLNQAKAIIVGGAPISPYQEILFKKLKIPIYATYGMTETCTHVAIRKIGGNTFKALEKVTFEIDQRNCLIINSPTAISNPLITNDIVELISSTSFIWKGRLDNVINSGGIKIQVEQLENKIAQILTELGTNIKFVISSEPDSKLGDKIILIAEEHFNTELVEQLLEIYEKPKKYYYVEKFPETETGKIDRNNINYI